MTGFPPPPYNWPGDRTSIATCLDAPSFYALKRHYTLQSSRSVTWQTLDHIIGGHVTDAPVY